MSLEPPGRAASDDEPTRAGPSSERPAEDPPNDDSRGPAFVQKPLFGGDLVRAAAAARVEGVEQADRPAPEPSRPPAPMADRVPDPTPEPEPEPEPSPVPDPKPMTAAPPGPEPLLPDADADPEPVAAPVAMAQAPAEPHPPAAVAAPPRPPATEPLRTEPTTPPELVTAPVAMAPAPPEPAPPAVAAPAAAAAIATYLPAGDDQPRRKRNDPRPRARKVRRIVRHVDPWSVLKISLFFYLALFVIVMIAGVVLWGLGRTTGTVDRVESFVTSLGFGNCEVDPNAPPPDDTTAVSAPSAPDEDGECGPGEVLVGGFQFEGGRLLQGFALAGLVLVVAGAAANTVLALLFNIISDVTGGLRFTVLEEVPAPRSSGSPR